MPVVIDQLEHVPESAGAETRGNAGGNPAGAAAPSAASSEAQTLVAIRREASRAARLWAD